MKKALFILAVSTLTAFVGTTARSLEVGNSLKEETCQSVDTVKIHYVHSVIESIFYDLPLEKSRLELRERMLHDKRFILTDSTFNDFKPSTFFKGITADKGLLKSDPDSIEVMLIYGNAALVTEKGGQADFNKNPMILECKYFFSNKDKAELEYGRILNLVRPIFTDTSSIKDDEWELQYSKGTEKCTGKIFDHFDPYYRVAIAHISFKPVNGDESIFILDIAFSKEDKRE